MKTKKRIVTLVLGAVVMASYSYHTFGAMELLKRRAKREEKAVRRAAVLPSGLTLHHQDLINKLDSWIAQIIATTKWETATDVMNKAVDWLKKTKADEKTTKLFLADNKTNFFVALDQNYSDHVRNFSENLIKKYDKITTNYKKIAKMAKDANFINHKGLQRKAKKHLKFTQDSYQLIVGNFANNTTIKKELTDLITATVIAEHQKALTALKKRKVVLDKLSAEITKNFETLIANLETDKAPDTKTLKTNALKVQGYINKIVSSVKQDLLPKNLQKNDLEVRMWEKYDNSGLKLVEPFIKKLEELETYANQMNKAKDKGGVIGQGKTEFVKKASAKLWSLMTPHIVKGVGGAKASGKTAAKVLQLDKQNDGREKYMEQQLETYNAFAAANIACNKEQK